MTRQLFGTWQRLEEKDVLADEQVQSTFLQRKFNMAALRRR
ncbi:MAG: hypothetical protein ACKVUS_06985 [Saprospiraceae bacterium]